MKEIFLVIFWIYSVTGCLFANGISDESRIPNPSVQIILPPELIGEYEFVYESPDGNHDFYGRIIIYENNKYWWRSNQTGQEWGHIIEENGDYYFYPLGGRAHFPGGILLGRKQRYYLPKTGFLLPVIGAKNLLREENMKIILNHQARPETRG
jgi:hypothetical protein